MTDSVGPTRIDQVLLGLVRVRDRAGAEVRAKVRVRARARAELGSGLGIGLGLELRLDQALLGLALPQKNVAARAVGIPAAHRAVGVELGRGGDWAWAGLERAGAASLVVYGLGSEIAAGSHTP